MEPNLGSVPSFQFRRPGRDSIRQMTIEDHYWKIKGIVRQLDRRESLYVIWAYCQYLQVNNFKIPADIEVADILLKTNPPQTILAEWTLELIAREVIRYAGEPPGRGRSLRQWGTLAVIANALRDLEGELYRQFIGRDRLHLELMRTAHRQFVWQQNHFNWKPIIRYYKLFSTPDIVTYAERTTGLTINQIYLIGIAYLVIFLESPRAARQLNNEIPGLKREDFDRFLDFTSLRWSAMATRLRSEHTLDESFLYRYSSLRKFPLVQISHHGREEIACPIPTLLFWRITTGLYYSLKDAPGFAGAFGASFQQYVGEVLRQRITNPGMTVLKEEQYHCGRQRKDSVDWIVQ